MKVMKQSDWEMTAVNGDTEYQQMEEIHFDQLRPFPFFLSFAIVSIQYRTVRQHPDTAVKQQEGLTSPLLKK